MSDTFYAMHKGEVFEYQTVTVTVGASSASTLPLELRVTDGQCTAEQVYQFLEKLADYFASRNEAVIVAGTLIG